MLKIDYLKQSKSGNQLQILSKINSKIFTLEYYRVTTTMAIALGDALASQIPMQVDVLNFINNEMSDLDLKQILIGLHDCHGLKSLSYMMNGFGPQSVYQLKEMFDNDALIKIKKVIFKDTNFIPQQN